MRKSLLLLCVLSACLPTKSELVTCKSSSDCTAGFQCDVGRGVCICDGTMVPGCAKLIDGGSPAQDVSIASDEAGPTTDAAVDAAAYDGSSTEAGSVDADQNLDAGRAGT